MNDLATCERCGKAFEFPESAAPGACPGCRAGEEEAERRLNEEYEAQEAQRLADEAYADRYGIDPHEDYPSLASAVGVPR